MYLTRSTKDAARAAHAHVQRTSHPRGFIHSFIHSFIYSGERATRSARHKSARDETLHLCVCAAALVFRVSSGRLVRRLSPVPRRPPYSYNAEDLPDQPPFSQAFIF